MIVQLPTIWLSTGCIDVLETHHNHEANSIRQFAKDGDDRVARKAIRRHVMLGKNSGRMPLAAVQIVKKRLTLALGCE